MSTTTDVDLGECTTADLAATSLKCSRKTVTRYIAAGKLEDAGTDADGRRLVTLSSLNRLRAEKATVPAVVTPNVQAPDPMVVRALDTLTEELREARRERERMVGQLQISTQSVSTLASERDLAKARADMAERELRRLSEGGLWSRRKKARQAVEKLEGLRGTDG